MNQGVEDFLRIAADGGGNILGTFSVGGHMATNFVEHVEELGCGSLTGFNSGLVVGVDVHQRGVESYGALKEGDEVAQGSRGDFLD